MQQTQTLSAATEIPRLIAELRAHIVRKTGKPLDPDIDFLTTEIEVRSMVQPTEVSWLGIGLTPKERQLLETLARRPGMVFRRESLMNVLYGSDAYNRCDKIVDVFILKIRRKLFAADADCWISSIYGEGYRFVKERARDAAKQVAAGPIHEWRRADHAPSCGYHLHMSLDECTCHKAGEL